MDYSKYTVLLTTDKQSTVGGERDNKNTETNSETGVAENNAPAESGGLFGGQSLVTWIIIYAVLIGGMYFFMSRPQKKKEKELRELQSALKIGDNVVTSAGFYGKIVDSTDDTFIVEFGTNKGVRIPVNKTEIFPTKKLDDIESQKSDK